jgi:hemerythrin
MRLLSWKDEYSVGIEAVDHEHRELIDLINRLHDELDAPAAKLTVPAFFGDLLKGISAHFALEEKFMRDRGYNALDAHKGDHERLLDDLCAIMDAYEHSEDTTASSWLSADTWFTRHFRTHDARFTSVGRISVRHSRLVRVDGDHSTLVEGLDSNEVCYLIRKLPTAGREGPLSGQNTPLA